jgi:hypothetical protein
LKRIKSWYICWYIFLLVRPTSLAECPLISCSILHCASVYQDNVSHSLGVPGVFFTCVHTQKKHILFLLVYFSWPDNVTVQPLCMFICYMGIYSQPLLCMPIGMDYLLFQIWYLTSIYYRRGHCSYSRSLGSTTGQTLRLLFWKYSYLQSHPTDKMWFATHCFLALCSMEWALSSWLFFFLVCRCVMAQDIDYLMGLLTILGLLIID